MNDSESSKIAIVAYLRYKRSKVNNNYLKTCLHVYIEIVGYSALPSYSLPNLPALKKLHTNKKTLINPHQSA